MSGEPPVGVGSLRRAFARENVFERGFGYATENGRPMDFAAWTKGINTPTETVEELTRLFRNASPALADVLRIEVVNGAIFVRSSDYHRSVKESK